MSSRVSVPVLRGLGAIIPGSRAIFAGGGPPCRGHEKVQRARGASRPRLQRPPIHPLGNARIPQLQELDRRGQHVALLERSYNPKLRPSLLGSGTHGNSRRPLRGVSAQGWIHGPSTCRQATPSNILGAPRTPAALKTPPPSDGSPRDRVAKPIACP